MQYKVYKIYLATCIDFINIDRNWYRLWFTKMYLGMSLQLLNGMSNHSTPLFISSLESTACFYSICSFESPLKSHSFFSSYHRINHVDKNKSDIFSKIAIHSEKTVSDADKLRTITITTTTHFCSSNQLMHQDTNSNLHSCSVLTRKLYSIYRLSLFLLTIVYI